MRKFLLLLYAFATLYATDGQYTLKLYETIFPSLFHKTPIVVYADAPSAKLLKRSRLFHLTDDCLHADVMIGSFQKLPEECINVPYFVTSYRYFKMAPNAIGTFYWRKGRPQLRFNLDQILANGLTLPDRLKKYAR